MSGPPAGATAAAYSPNTQCDCWAATLRIVNLCSRGRGPGQSQGLPQGQAGAGAHAQASPSSTSGTGSMSSSLLSDTLTMGRNLVQHWETLNGCASSASHMDPQTLHYMAESINWVVRDYETAVDAMSQAPERHSVSMPTPASNSTSNQWDNERAAGWNIPRAFVGNLELEPTEAILVAQEALSHSIARLTVMLQDVEEEAGLQRQRPNADYSLREKDLKDLVTRLFRLLGKVNSCAAVDH